MTATRKKLLTGATILIASVFAIAGVSKPGRGMLARLIDRFAAHQQSPTAVAERSRDGLDVEQRARAAHGWTPQIANSVAQGSIIYYDASGVATSQHAITITRGYPDRVRVEINRGANVEVFGFDQTSSWKRGAAKLKDTEARDIRAFARMCPERLFVTRFAGAEYAEAGQSIEDPGPPPTVPDWTTSSPTAPAAEGNVANTSQHVFDQIEMVDSLGALARGLKAGDVRRVRYYVDPATSLVSAARWHEPDNPRRSIDDEAASFSDVRVDFNDWREAGGVKWPFKLTHSTGGRVDFKIVLNDVSLNQSLTDLPFQRP